VMVSKN